jgi:hypothetical protein
MNVEFKLSAATSGTTASTAFDISGTTSSNVTTLLEAGVTKDKLLTGHTINGVNDAITGGTIASISPSTCTGYTTTWTVIQPTPTPTPTVTPTPTQLLYNVYELCGWTDPAYQYKYILYNVTYGTKGFIDTTTCASQVSVSGGITLSAVNTAYPLAMQAGSFTTDPISCAECN